MAITHHCLIRTGFGIYILLCLKLNHSLAITPGAVIEIIASNATTILTIFTSEAVFGPKLHFGKPPVSHEASIYRNLERSPDSNPFLCDDPYDDVSVLKDSIVLVPRGQCTYKRKVRNAERLGAKHVIIYNTLASKYSYYSTLEDPSLGGHILYPTKYVDYDCNNGAAWIPKNELKFHKFPYDDENDKLLSGTNAEGNLCAIHSDLSSSTSNLKFEDTCASQRCLFSGKERYDTVRQDFVMEACCAWDLYDLMGDDNEIEDVHITSSYLTMNEAGKLLNILGRVVSPQAIVYARWYPVMNVSNFLIFVLAVFTLWYSSWMAAQLYRNVCEELLSEAIDLGDESPPLQNVTTNDESMESDGEGVLDHAEQAQANNSSLQEAPQHVTSEQSGERNDTSVARRLSLPRITRLSSHPRLSQSFVIFGAMILLVLFLFFARLPDVVLVSYGVGGSLAMGHLMIYPLLRKLFDITGMLKTVTSPVYATQHPIEIQILDILCVLLVAALSACWIWFGFSQSMPQSSPFYWILQNVMGFAICVAVLGFLRFDSIKVPTLIIIMTFFFNVFFTVSITVFAGGEMKPSDGLERVVRIEQDYLKCEKYKELESIRGGCASQPSPISFSIPLIHDYRGGWSSLGLINILVPGLLCAFVARYDAAKNVMKCINVRERAARRGLRHVNDRHTIQRMGVRRIFSGYFSLLTFAYALSLSWAFVGYYLTGRNQPVLIYIVPFTLGTMLVRTKLKGDLISLWDGPRRLILSQMMVYIVANNGIGTIGTHRFDDGDFTVDTRSIISSDSDDEPSSCDNQESNIRS